MDKVCQYKDHPSSFLLGDMIIVTDIQAGKIFKAPIETLDFEAIPVQNVSHPVAVDYDAVDHKLYWADQQLRAIMRANLDGTQEEVVVRDLMSKNVVEVMQV